MTPVRALIAVAFALASASALPAAPAPLPKPGRGGPETAELLDDLDSRGYHLPSLELVEGDHWLIQVSLKLQGNGILWVTYGVRAPSRLAALRAFQQGKGRYEPDRVHGGIQ
jgi:hypothetical protein